MNALQQDFALYPLAEKWGVRQVYAFYRGALKTLSFNMEESILNMQCKGSLFAGFQKFSFFLPRIKMYKKLAQVVDNIWIFGIPDVSLPQIPNIHYVPISEEHQLVKEWFLLIDSPQFFSCLVAEDLTGLDTPSHEREFRGIWTFDDVLVTYLQTRLVNSLDIPQLTRHSKSIEDFSQQLTAVGSITNRLVQSLEQSNQQLVKAEKFRDELTQMLVHDMRSPLTAIILRLGTILQIEPDARDPESMENSLNSILQLAHSLSKMIDDLLNVSLLRTGDYSLSKSKINPQDLLDVASSLIKPSVEKHNLTFFVNFLPEYPVIEGEFDKLIRVLTNLLSNAVKFSLSGGTITLSAARVGNDIEFVVSDTGIGIDKEHIDKVFEKFETGDQDIASGTGIGLAYCKLMVENHGGKIWVESQKGEGATFRFTIPIVSS